MDDDQCDLEELSAFLDEDSNESNKNDTKEKEKGMSKGMDEELDDDALAALLDSESNDATPNPATSDATENNKKAEASEELDADSIAAFLQESDSEDESAPDSTAALANAQPEASAPNESPTGPGLVSPTADPSALQAELLAMQKRMMELQQMLSQSQPQQSQPQQQTQQTQQQTQQQSQSQILKSPQVSKSKTRLLEESKDQNPFFSSTNNGKKVTPPKKKDVPRSGHTPSQSSNTTYKPSYLAQADREKMKREMFGDSDSDMEDMDGEKPGLSDQGKQMKSLLNAAPKQRVAHESKLSPETQRKPPADWKNKSVVTRESLGRSSLPTLNDAKKASAKPEEKFIVDSFSGTRIVRPLISSGELELKMKGRKVIKLSRLHLKVNTPDLQGDWVTIGVVVQKMEPKQSSTGKTFCIWKLADLDDCDQSVSFFLFGQTYKEHWKNDAGSVIGLLNPSIMDNADKGNKDVAFTINNPKQLLMIGRSKDLGWCSGRTKKGNICNHFINKKYGDFCSYHVQSAYKKTSSSRTELQGSVTGVTPKNYQRAMLPKKGSHFIYGGQTFASLPTMKASLPKKDGVTLSKLQVEQQLSRKKVTTMTLHELKTCDTATMKKAPTTEKDQAFLDMIATPTVGSLNFVKHLIKQEHVEKVTKEKSVMKSVTPKELISQHKKDMMERRKLRAAQSGAPPTKPADPLQATPSLGKGLQSGDDIFLDISPSRKLFSPASSRSLEIAKRKAIEKISGKGGISKQDPNAAHKSPDQGKVKKRLRESIEKDEHAQDGDHAKEPPAKKSRLLGNVDVNSPEFQRILKAKSSHKGALAQAESEREEKYFNELEKKEKMEDKMQSVTKLEVTVVTCKLCKYTAFSASETCKKENHNIVRHKGIKRFFKCKHCKNRTYSLDKYPKDACSNCGSSSFERTSMAREKTGPKLESETLCLRGDEQKFLNSLGGQTFLGVS